MAAATSGHFGSLPLVSHCDVSWLPSTRILSDARRRSTCGRWTPGTLDSGPARRRARTSRRWGDRSGAWPVAFALLEQRRRPAPALEPLERVVRRREQQLDAIRAQVSLDAVELCLLGEDRASLRVLEAGIPRPAPATCPCAASSCLPAIGRVVTTLPVAVSVPCFSLIGDRVGADRACRSSACKSTAPCPCRRPAVASRRTRTSRR